MARREPSDSFRMRAQRLSWVSPRCVVLYPDTSFLLGSRSHTGVNLDFPAYDKQFFFCKSPPLKEG